MITLIGDVLIKNILVNESNEPIVDLRKEFPSLLFDDSRLHVRKDSFPISLGRKIVGEKLIAAENQLPEGTRLLIKECYRPLSAQRKSWDEYGAYLRQKFPLWSEKDIYQENCKLNAPLDVAPHATGGAVDLTLVDSFGKCLEMGTEFNASPLDTENRTFTDAQNISAEAKRHRKLLSDAMKAAGFINYPTEWWHWSYGDKYWAFMTGNGHAIFGVKADITSV